MPCPPFCRAQPGIFLLPEGQTGLWGAPSANPAPGLARCLLSQARCACWTCAGGALRGFLPHQAGIFLLYLPCFPPKMLTWHSAPSSPGSSFPPSVCQVGAALSSPHLFLPKYSHPVWLPPKIPRAQPGQEPALLPSLVPEAPRTALAVPTPGVSG